jgi:hypothetical protein
MLKFIHIQREFKMTNDSKLEALAKFEQDELSKKV